MHPDPRDGACVRRVAPHSARLRRSRRDWIGPFCEGSSRSMYYRVDHYLARLRASRPGMAVRHRQPRERRPSRRVTRRGGSKSGSRGDPGLGGEEGATRRVAG